MSSCSSIAFWKDYAFSVESLFHLCQKLYFLWVYFWALSFVSSIYTSNFLLLPHCLDYCSYTVSHKNQVVWFFPTLFFFFPTFILFKKIFCSSNYFAFSYKFWNQFICISKESSWDSDSNCDKAVDQFGGELISLLCWVFHSMNTECLHLFRSSLISFINILYFSSYRFCTCLLDLYLIFFYAFGSDCKW